MVPEDRSKRFWRGDGPNERFNLAEFARFIEQPFAHDANWEVWYFGPPRWQWSNQLSGGLAPDFTLQYFDGKELKDVSLHDYRGKKNVVLAFYIFAFTGG